MATILALRDRLTRRLGLSALTSPEQERLNEALFAAVSRIHADRDPGFSYSELTAETYGTSAVTITTHNAHASSLTLTVPTGTSVGDILVIGTKRWLIYDYGATSIDVGAAIQTSLTGETGTIYHRIIQLPTTGTVLEVVDLTNNTRLELDAHGLSKYGLSTTGSPVSYEQRYSREAGKSQISLWPAPTAAVQLAITSGFALDQLETDTDIEGSDTFFDKILEKAVDIWRGWQPGGHSPGELSASKRGALDTANSGSSSSAAVAVSGIKRRGRR